MNLTKLKLVTIIAESVLEHEIIEKLIELGATGYTVVESRGQGSSNRHGGEIPGQNVRIETLADESAACLIAERINHHYFNSYSVICFLIDAWVVREKKYTSVVSKNNVEDKV